MHYVVLWVLFFSTPTEPPKTNLMVENVREAISLYEIKDLVKAVGVGDNKRVVVCESSDQTKLFSVLDSSKDWRKDRWPNLSHRGRIRAWRAKATPSLHITEVQPTPSNKSGIEADVDREPLSLVRLWNPGRHLLEVIYHRVTGSITSQTAIKKGLDKLKVKLDQKKAQATALVATP
jgi:hypothetical protein